MSNGRDWTADDRAKLRRLVAAGWTNAQIGDEMDRHEDSVRHKREQLEMRGGQSRAETLMMRRINYRKLVRA